MSSIFVIVFSLCCIYVFAVDPNFAPLLKDDAHSMKSEHDDIQTKLSSLAANLTSLWQHVQASDDSHKHSQDHDHDHDDHDNAAHVHVHLHVEQGSMRRGQGRRGQGRLESDDLEDEIHAHCEMKPNDYMPATVTRNHKVEGRIHMVQKSGNSPVEMDIHLAGFDMSGDHSTVVHEHGFHIHTYGDLRRGCESLGSHYDPLDVDHGAPDSRYRHVADLGNIHCNDAGDVNIRKTDSVISLRGSHSIIGRSIVIHEGPDDLGLGNTAASRRGGDAGGRIACCVIGRARTVDFDHHDASRSHDTASHVHHGHQSTDAVTSGDQQDHHVTTTGSSA